MEYSDLDKRCKDMAYFILENNTTIRKTAEHFNISKSSVYINLSKRFKKVDNTLYILINEHFKKNVAVRHFRGGLSTKKKYAALKKSRQNKA